MSKGKAQCTKYEAMRGQTVWCVRGALSLGWLRAAANIASTASFRRVRAGSAMDEHQWCEAAIDVDADHRAAQVALTFHRELDPWLCAIGLDAAGARCAPREYWIARYRDGECIERHTDRHGSLQAIALVEVPKCGGEFCFSGADGDTVVAEQAPGDVFIVPPTRVIHWTAPVVGTTSIRLIFVCRWY